MKNAVLEALEPFAAIARWLGPSWKDHERQWPEALMRKAENDVPSVGDLRKILTLVEAFPTLSVSVVELEWFEDGDKLGEDAVQHAHAFSPLGSRYTIYESPVDGIEWTNSYGGGGTHLPSVQAARDACQAHLDRRILGCLAPRKKAIARPLEWDVNSFGNHTATTPFGIYWIVIDGHSVTWTFDHSTRGASSIEAAKEAIQADFEARVRGCIP